MEWGDPSERTNQFTLNIMEEGLSLRRLSFSSSSTFPGHEPFVRSSTFDNNSQDTVRHDWVLTLTGFPSGTEERVRDVDTKGLQVEDVRGQGQKQWKCVVEMNDRIRSRNLVE